MRTSASSLSSIKNCAGSLRLIFRREPLNHSLQPTALVHEAYMRLIQIDQVDWQSRAHFFCVASTEMRRILVDHARANRAQKRGGREDTLWLDESILPSPSRPPESLHWTTRSTNWPSWTIARPKLLEMRFFAGMTEEENWRRPRNLCPNSKT